VGTASAEAYDAYLSGLSYWYRHTPQAHVEALQQFERAVGHDPAFLRARAAAAKVYLFAFTRERSYSAAIGQHPYALLRRALTHLEVAWHRPIADVHVMRSWLAFRRHQLDLAIAEAEHALDLSPNDADALEALAEALIYAGRTEEGGAFADRALRQSPIQPAAPLYVKGIAAFVAGDPAGAVELFERAGRFAPEPSRFAAILAAAYSELGDAAAASGALELYKKALGTGGSLEDALWRHPFEELAVAERFAAGLKAAGAKWVSWEFLPIDRDNRLSGEELRALLFGHSIQGLNMTLALPWRQTRTVEGAVQDTGRWRAIWYAVPSGGVGRIEGDRLCETWPDLSAAVPFCVSVHRLPPGPWSRIGDYVMVNDLGAHLFKVVD
jgi:tetratricopeptide (TPR) repeat protein